MRRRALLRALAATLVAGGLLTAASLSHAEQHGTREQAQAMVAKAIALYDEKGKAAFEVMDQGAASGFRQEDLYIFVIGTGPDARVVAHGLDRQRIGAVVAALTDSRGKALWQGNCWRGPRLRAPGSIMTASIRRAARKSRNRAGSFSMTATSSAAGSISGRSPERSRDRRTASCISTEFGPSRERAGRALPAPPALHSASRLRFSRSESGGVSNVVGQRGFRTSDPLHPMQVRYQAAPLPEKRTVLATSK